MFLSIFVATCRPKNIAPFLDNLANTCEDVNSFEVLFKLDEGADDLVAIIEDYKSKSSLQIKYLTTDKLEGYYSLDVGYNEMLKIANPETYFCWLLTDEICIQTQGWDGILKKYIHFYPDDIFRIKLSIFQLKNYNDFYECLPCPDNYAVTTRKWLEITGGWGHFWGPDSWHQCIDYYLSFCKNEFHPFGVWRSFPIYDIQVGGQEAGQGIEDPEKLRERVIRIYEGWQKHSTHAAQENFNKLANFLNAHIYANGKKFQQYIIHDNLRTKTLRIYSVEGNIEAPTSSQDWSYKVSKFSVKLMVGRKKLNISNFLPKLYVFRWKIPKFLRVQFSLTRKAKKLVEIMILRLYQIIIITKLHKIPSMYVNKLITQLLKLHNRYVNKHRHIVTYLYDGNFLNKLDENFNQDSSH